MKLCFSSFVCPDWNVEHLLAAGPRWGYTGVELRCDARHAHGVEVYTEPYEQRHLRELLGRAGLEAVCLATSLCLTDPTLSDLLPERAALAGNLGARGLRMYVGPRHGSMSDYEYQQVLGERLRYAAMLTEAENVELWLETFAPFGSGAALAALIHETQPRHVGVVWDVLETHTAKESPETTLQALGRMLHMVRLHDARRDADGLLPVPLGEGEVPITDVLATLSAADYQGYICGQWLGNLYAVQPDEALESFHTRYQSLLMKQSIAAR